VPATQSTTLPEDRTIWGLVEWRARRTPDALMLVDEHGRRMTFAGYRDAAERAAAGLHAAGVREGDVVAWLLPTRIESIVLFAALSRLGAVQNPLVPIYREREVAFCARQTKASLLMVPSSWRGFDYAAMAEKVAADDGALEVLVLGSALPDRDAAALPAHVPRGVGDDSPVRFVYYTSGSTSDPKGAMHTDAGLISGGQKFADRLELRPADRVSLVFPFAHIGGSNFLVAGLLSGCAHVCVEQFAPEATVDVLAREGVTIAGSGTPFHLAYLAVQRSRPGRPIFPNLRACNSGGGPKPDGLHDEIKRELGGVGLVSGYGLTECPLVAMNDLHSPDEVLARTEGRPPPGVRVRVVASGERECVAGEEGELRVEAPQMLVGYVDASLDAAAFDERGFFRTGDLGRFDADGNVVVTGRLKDIIIRKGENISAKEVEDLLYAHPAVADVAVIGVPDAALGERCCAVVVPAETHAPPSLDAIAAFLREQGLMVQKIPEQLEVVAELPRAPSGKVLKQALKGRFASGSSGGA
jgi:acyl-CoA synthetase (AMP-forming)/AMP-acid ligase II